MLRSSWRFVLQHAVTFWGKWEKAGPHRPSLTVQVEKNETEEWGCHLEGETVLPGGSQSKYSAA